MQGATKKAMAPPKECSVLVGTPNAVFLQRLGQEVQHLVGPASVSFASSLGTFARDGQSKQAAGYSA